MHHLLSCFPALQVWQADFPFHRWEMGPGIPNTQGRHCKCSKCLVLLLLTVHAESHLPLTTLRVSQSHDQTRRSVILTSVSSMSELGYQGSVSRPLSVLSAAGLSLSTSWWERGASGDVSWFPSCWAWGTDTEQKEPVFREQVWKTGPCSMKGTWKP